MKKTSLFIFILILLSFTGHGQETILEIRYGSQFGMCDGYCFSETLYVPLNKTQIRKAWIDTVSNPIKINKSKMDILRWNDMISTVNLESFFKLEETIGCPDCDDGGETWVFIKTDQRQKKVAFEYNKTPLELKALTSILID